MVYKGNLGEDGQISGIIGHAGQLRCALLKSLNISLPVKSIFKCSFLFTHPLNNSYCCCHLTAGPLPIHWVRPYIMLLLPPCSWSLPIHWVRPWHTTVHLPYNAICSRWKSFTDGQDTFNLLENFCGSCTPDEF